MKNECSIIRDILPLYVENMVSEDTSEFVKEHLESCPACRCVVLLHDTKATGQTVKALPDMIAWFREQGYTFCTVSQMNDLQN